MGKRDYECAIIILAVLLSAYLGNHLMPALIGSANYLYFVKPLFWLLLSFYVWKKPRVRFKGKLRVYKYVVLWSTICGIIYLVAFFSAGFLDGIGVSPYSKDLTGIMANVACFGSVLVLMEWVRSYIINMVKKKYLLVFAIATVMVFSLYGLNIRILLNISGLQGAVKYLGEYVIPEIAKNALLTYMVYTAGPYPAMIYTALTSMPAWIAPVLPNLSWITRAFVGTMLPMVFFVILKYLYMKQTREIKLREQKLEKPYAWVTASIIAIGIIWFAVGVFPVYPTVILTGSMMPELKPGDVALISKTDGHALEIGDVVQYWTGEYFIIHRIIEVDPDTGWYRTKGDNNSVPDANLVAPEQVRGRMVKVIPKLGILTLIFRSGGDTPAGAEF